MERGGRILDFTVDHFNRTTAEQWMQGSTVVNTIATGYNFDGEVTSAGDSYSNYALGYGSIGPVPFSFPACRASSRFDSNT